MTKIIGRYISSQILYALFLALGVYTFVLFMGNLLRMIDFFVKVLNTTLIVKFIISALPFALSFSIPLALLTAILFVAGRMSADNEVMALQASGISFLIIFIWPLLLSIAVSCIALIVNDYVNPAMHYRMRQAKNNVSSVDPIHLLSPGTFVSCFKPYRFYVERRQGHTLYNIIIHERIGTRDTVRLITAKRGMIMRPQAQDAYIHIKLFDGILEEPPVDASHTMTQLHFSEYAIKLDLYDTLKKDRIVEKRKTDMTNAEIRQELKEYQKKLATVQGAEAYIKIRKDISCSLFEIQQRIAFGMAPFFFTVLGFPLGFLIHRSEKAIVVAITIGLAGIYYAGMILIEGINTFFYARPDLLIWIPNLLFGIAGLYLIYHLSFRRLHY